MATWIGIGTADPGDDIKVGSHKVGIGTTSPSKPLHLRGEMLIDDDSPAGWQSGSVAKLSMGDTSSYLQNNYGGSFVISSNNCLKIETTSGSGPQYSDISIMPGASGSGRVGINTTSPANMLSVAGGADVSGSVGVGTTSPGAKLEVTGDVQLSKGADRKIEIPDQTSSDNAGNNLTIEAGSGKGVGDGGSVTIQAGSADNQQGYGFGDGGNVLIVPGLKGTGQDDIYGRVGVGTTSPSAFLDVQSNDSSAVPLNVIADPDCTTNLANFQVGSSTRQFVISPNGYVGIYTSSARCALDVQGNGIIMSTYLEGTGSADLQARSDGLIERKSSDRRLKENIKTIKGALEKVARLRGVTFDWKDPEKMGPSDYGLIGQEVEEVVPELVSKNKEGYLSVKYSNMVGLLIEAIKEQQAQISALEKKLSRKKAE